MRKKTIERNPFVSGANTLKYYKKTSERVIAYDEGADYNHSGTIIKSHYLVEAHRKTTLYCSTTKTMDDIVFRDLSSKSRDLLWYIMIHITEDQDYIRLPYDTLIATLRMSRNSVMLAMKELKENNFIVAKSQSVYWVNPAYIFRGNRLKYYSKIDNDIIEVI